MGVGPVADHTFSGAKGNRRQFSGQGRIADSDSLMNRLPIVGTASTSLNPQAGLSSVTIAPVFKVLVAHSNSIGRVPRILISNTMPLDFV